MSIDKSIAQAPKGILDMLALEGAGEPDLEIEIEDP